MSYWNVHRIKFEYCSSVGFLFAESHPLYQSPFTIVVEVLRFVLQFYFSCVFIYFYRGSFVGVYFLFDVIGQHYYYYLNVMSSNVLK